MMSTSERLSTQGYCLRLTYGIKYGGPLGVIFLTRDSGPRFGRSINSQLSALTFSATMCITRPLLGVVGMTGFVRLFSSPSCML